MSARLRSLINVIDVEATCWREGTQPAGQTSDIIEIGITVVDVSEGLIVSTDSILVKPERSEISTFCTELTTLTPELIAQEGIAFQEALRRLKKGYDAGTRIFASWGDYDRQAFERQCTAMQLKSPFGPTHMNVKTLHALSRSTPMEMGMDQALREMALPLIGTHHRGGDDSRNIATVLLRLLEKLRA